MIPLATLQRHAKNIRRDTLVMASRAKAANLGGALSVVEILTALYFAVLRIDPKRPDHEDRDRLLFSKGHCAAAFYATLVARGFAPRAMLDRYYENDTMITTHPTRGCLPGVEISSGSLGHGLPMGAGLSWAGKYDRRPYRVFVVMSDGECDEGSTWEAALVASHHQLDNLVAIIDYNKIQSFGATREVLNLEPFRDKWAAFGWNAREVDGHDLRALVRIFRAIPFQRGRPSIVICHTIKGKGVPALENTLQSHYHTPDDAQLKDALKRLETKA